MNCSPARFCIPFALPAILFVAGSVGAPVSYVHADTPFGWSTSDTARWYQDSSPETLPTVITNADSGASIAGGSGDVSYYQGDFQLSGTSSAGPAGLHAHAAAVVTPSVPNVAIGGSTRASVAWHDTQTISLTGTYNFVDQLHSFAVLWFQTTGSFEGLADSNVAITSAMEYSARMGSAGPPVTAGASFTENGNVIHQVAAVGVNPLPNDNGLLSLEPFGASLATSWSNPSVSFPFLVSLTAEAQVSVLWDSNRDPDPTSGGVETDFSHTLDILGFEVVDGNGNPLPAGSFTMSSASGYDYPMLYAAPAVPEPSTCLLAGLGAISLLAYRRRLARKVGPGSGVANHT